MLETSQSNGGVVYVGNQLTNGGVVYVGDQSVKRWCGLFWRPVSQMVVWSMFMLETG